MQPRRVWLNRLIIAAVFVLPITLFFVTQRISDTTRSGSVDEVWFATTGGGERLIARDRIVVGAQANARVIHRLALVDLGSGERVARQKVDGALDFAGTSEGALWFTRKEDGRKVVLSAEDLDELSAPEAAPATPGSASHPPLGTQVTLPGGESWSAPGPAVPSDAGEGSGARPLDPARFPGASILVDAVSGQPIVTDQPPSFFVVFRTQPRGPLELARVDANGQAVWTATLERQRALHAASLRGEALVVVSAGAARDFAMSLELGTGKTRWVHHF